MPEIIVKLGDNIVQKFFFFQESLSVGRSSENEIVIENLAVSRQHAMIRFEDGHYYIEDFGSSNGTFVNGVRIKKTKLVDKDVVGVGKHQLFFYDQQQADVVRRPSMQDADQTMMFEVAEIPPAMIVVDKGRQKGGRYDLTAPVTRIGRSPECEIRLTDWFVSKQHAEIEQTPQGYVIRDLGSWRHTFVNGVAIEEQRLALNDVILIGPTVELHFRAAGVKERNGAGSRRPEELSGEDPNAVEPRARALHEEQSPIPGIATANLGAIWHPPEDEAAGGNGATPVPPEEEPSAEAEFSTATSEEAVRPALDDPDADLERNPDEVEAVYEDMAEASLLAAADAATAARIAAMPAAIPPASDQGTCPATEPSPQPEAATDADPDEIQMWERALSNKSLIIRKQAAKRLKQLTGRDYDF